MFTLHKSVWITEVKEKIILKNLDTSQKFYFYAKPYKKKREKEIQGKTPMIFKFSITESYIRHQMVDSSHATLLAVLFWEIIILVFLEARGGEPFYSLCHFDIYYTIHGPYKIINLKIILLYLVMSSSALTFLQSVQSQWVTTIRFLMSCTKNALLLWKV